MVIIHPIHTGCPGPDHDTGHKQSRTHINSPHVQLAVAQASPGQLAWPAALALLPVTLLPVHPPCQSLIPDWQLSWRLLLSLCGPEDK